LPTSDFRHGRESRLGFNLDYPEAK
jgi:hypothetical protein